MKISKWRIGVVAVPTLISIAEWPIQAFNKYAFQRHWQIIHLMPNVGSTIYFFLNPFGCGCDFTETSNHQYPCLLSSRFQCRHELREAG
jgi:hypothetical protein